MKTAVYSGTFDPPTLGHLDIIARAGKVFDRLIVGIFSNSAKSPLFTRDERLAMLRRETAGYDGDIEVQACDGLIVDFCSGVGATIIVRGLRNATDMDYEGQMAGMNHMLDDRIDTVFLLADPALQPIASSLVKDVARSGGDISRFVSAGVAADVAAKLGA
ncbi:pantetheine-phosphate adenylyltransferase [Sphingomonas vulcanisoli]|uniref:Phosphopantetheine adenylyltransferase n=1 Tax=Sphingomonas vulcanisoli TaxID=1658060 RepID=A0ABX0TUT1_9SPHN|nr:pantetheine-phosphate adenylyltransferase [Sphingomonas vulcanisoli]NIJ07924.1 pantetheine-phosphate adenylyltransferase [Sphingomonas vulcanisoli]